MNDFTFLTCEQVKGSRQLDILKKYGTKCAITDFSILLGVRVEKNCYTIEGNNLKDRAAEWWINSFSVIDNNYNPNYISTRDTVCFTLGSESYYGARPALSYSSISSNCSNRARIRDGILEVEYGEYPQMVVSEDFSKVLEDAFVNMSYSNTGMKTTGKSYTTDYAKTIYSSVSSNTKTYTEYGYKGKKYIRFVGELCCRNSVLSDGRKIQVGSSYWVKVEPIVWLIDEKADIALSKKIIFSGVPFDIEYNCKGDFNKSVIKNFMDRQFSKDIIPSFSKEITLSFLNEISNKEKKEVYKGENEEKNPYRFNFDKVSEEDIIRGAIESGIAVFLHGKSSEGKSARVKQIDPNCVTIYLRNATIDGLNGKSVYNSITGEMIDVKPTWLKKLEDRCEKEPNKYHILFLDEITNALPSIQGTAFNIVLDREVNGIWKLPENARIVAAGNEINDSLAANGLAEPLFNRFAHVYIKTTVESWLRWASEHKIHPAIYTYIAYRKGEPLRSKYDGESPNADPRKWEMASKMLYATGRPEMLRALVGEDITKEFCQFCYQRVITLDDVLKGNYSERDLQMNTAELCATAMGLSQVDEANFTKVRKFVKKLGEEPCAIFDSLWASGNEARMEIVAEARLVVNKRGRKLK